jgi:hypothetical protein
MMTLIIGDQIISETQGTITLHESGVIITPQCIEPEQLLAQIKSKLRGMFQYELVNHDDKSVGLWIKLFPDCPTIDILFSDTSEE